METLLHLLFVSAPFLVSEGLNSVETPHKKIKPKTEFGFQKDLIVWKQSIIFVRLVYC